MAKKSKRKITRGRGIVSSALKKVASLIPTVVNRGIDLLPIEAHLPGYNYCGPGTKLKKRLARGDKGINPLDEACKAHDIAYSMYSDNTNRRQADKELLAKAWQRVKAADSSMAERAAALAVSTGMKAKTVIGGGKKKKSSSGDGLYLRPYPKGGKGVCPKISSGKKKKKKPSSGDGLYLRPHIKGGKGVCSKNGGRVKKRSYR